MAKTSFTKELKRAFYNVVKCIFCHIDTRTFCKNQSERFSPVSSWPIAIFEILPKGMVCTLKTSCLEMNNGRFKFRQNCLKPVDCNFRVSKQEILFITLTYGVFHFIELTHKAFLMVGTCNGPCELSCLPN